jgi:hypothetical protein
MSEGFALARGSWHSVEGAIVRGTSQEDPIGNPLLNRALEVFVYLPVGLAKMGQDNIRKAVEIGRATVTSQVAMFRSVGEFAVNYLGKELRRRIPVVGDAQDKVAAVEDGTLGAGDGIDGVRRESVLQDSGEPTDAHLPIENYDALAASQIVGMLEGLTRDELDEIERYERAHRARRTVLAKISQLRRT